MSIDNDYLMKQIDAIPAYIPNELERELSNHFDKCGLFYRIFSRCKKGCSSILKIENKGYESNGKKMQDLIGVRVALYFKDDIELCVKIIQHNYSVIEIVRDTEESDTFKPQRLNIVCNMPESIINQFSSELWQFPIDSTFEIQIRTIFSEGWHEVEHDLRYKHKRDWDEHIELSRNLNGLFATLETCDWAMINVLDQLAYQKYQKRDWESMLRNHFRIRLDNDNLSDAIIDIFNNNLHVAKEFFKVDRKKLLIILCDSRLSSFPKKINNIVYLANELIIKSKEISDLTPPIIKDRLKKLEQ